MWSLQPENKSEHARTHLYSSITANFITKTNTRELILKQLLPIKFGCGCSKSDVVVGYGLVNYLCLKVTTRS